MKRQAASAFIPCLFEIPEPPKTEARSQAHRDQVCRIVCEMLKASRKTRGTVAKEMTDLSGREVTKNMLDAYCSERRGNFNIPAYLIPSLELSTDRHDYTEWLCTVRGGAFLLGKEVLNAELGRLERIREKVIQRMREVKRLIGEAE